MIQQLLNHIERHNLCKTTDKILLAVSGGVDSMVMLHLLKSAGFHIGVAHCNFQLREAESDSDQALVETFCQSNSISFHCQRFETLRIAEERKASIQVVARALRYEFFNDVLDKHGYDWIATAHHVNDNLETILLNLTRGTGLEGVAGIPVKNGQVIRPLLFASRKEIELYASAHAIPWREDSSNPADDYSRNMVRHHVIPKLAEINPGLEKAFANTAERLQLSGRVYQEKLDELFAHISNTLDQRLIIQIDRLKNQTAPAVILWELLKAYGFRYEQCVLMLDQHQPGKQYESQDYTLLVDRETLIMEKKFFQSGEVKFLHEADGFIEYEDYCFGLSTLSANHQPLDRDAEVAQLDFDLLVFPLILRPWTPGDAFIPLGMQQSKKVSDFLIDQKVNLLDKKRVLVLESDNRIAWVAGYRIDDRFKVTASTRKVWKVQRKKRQSV